MPKSSSLVYYLIYLLVAFIYPAYESVRAVESLDRNDDTVWLMYWVVLAAFTLLEFASDGLLFWVPLYSIAKITFLLWCTAPVPHNGAYYIYKIFLQQLYVYCGKEIECALTDGPSAILNS